MSTEQVGMNTMLSQDAIDKRREAAAREDELIAMSKRHTCAICNAPLVTPWDGERMILVCGQDRTHQGYRRGKTLVESFKEGVAMPVEIANVIERKLGGKRMEISVLQQRVS